MLVVGGQNNFWQSRILRERYDSPEDSRLRGGHVLDQTFSEEENWRPDQDFGENSYSSASLDSLNSDDHSDSSSCSQPSVIYCPPASDLETDIPKSEKELHHLFPDYDMPKLAHNQSSFSYGAIG